MTRFLVPLFLAIVFGISAPLSAGPNVERFGGDTFVAGSGSGGRFTAERDIFAAGPSITVEGTAAGDIHAFGADVEIEAATESDLYAAGGTVRIRAPVGGDTTVAAGSIRSAGAAETRGNARFFGGTITIDGPVDGALSALGGEVILNARIGGDARLVGESLTFGPDAEIAGTLFYSTREEIDIPARVAPPERIRFEPYSRSEFYKEIRDEWIAEEYPVLPGFLSLFAGFLVTLAFFIVVGAVFLAFAPATVSRLRKTSLSRPGLTLLTGVIGLSILFGIIPISMMTIVGLPLVPVAILMLIVVWTFGYILGAYVVALRVLFAFLSDNHPTMPVRLAALALGVTAFTLLNFVPFLGWLANLTLVLLGVGAITAAVFEWLVGNPMYTLDADMNPPEQN